MHYSTTIQSIKAALERNKRAPVISREDFVSVEDALEALGDYPGIIGETLLAFRRAVGLLKRAHDSSDEEAILMVSGHVRELWETLGPALEKLAERRK